MIEGMGPGAPGGEPIIDEIIDTPVGKVRSRMGGAAAEGRTTKTSTEQIGPGSEFHEEGQRRAEAESAAEAGEPDVETQEEAEEPDDVDRSWSLRSKLGKTLSGWKAKLRRKRDEPAEPDEVSPEDVVNEELGPEDEPTVEIGDGTEKPSRFDAFRNRMVDSFRHSADRLKRRFTGEALEEEEADYKHTKTDVAGAVATGLLSVAMTYTGTKFFVDMPQYVSQKICTGRERERILEYLKGIDEEAKESFAADIVEKKKELIKARIEKSTFLTEAKKTELIAKLQSTSEQYHTEMGEHENARNEQFALALKEAIDSRIKGTQVLKEGVNTALVASGVATFRTIGYTTFALVERYKKVQAERAEGKREGGVLHEMFVAGAQETWHNLKGGDAEDWKGRSMNRLKAATVLMRGAAIGSLAGGELIGDEKIMDIIEKSMRVFEEKGAVGGAIQHMGEHAAIFLGESFDPNSEANRLAAAAAPESMASAGGLERTDIPHEADLPGSEHLPDAIQGAEHLPEANVEIPTEEIEGQGFDAELLKATTVAKDSSHNSIVGLIQAQLKAHPEQFGYKGDHSGVDAWASRTALDAARHEGFVTTAGDTRLATEAIGRMAVVATHEGDGVGIAFVDTHSNAILSASEAHDMGLTYGHEVHFGGGETLAHIETHGAAGIDKLDVGGGQGLDFDYDATGEVVNGMNFEGLDTLSPADSETAMAMMGGMDSVNETLLGQAAERKEDIEDLSERLVAWTKILEKLDKEGLGGTAEAMAIREAAEGDLNYVDSFSQSFGSVDTNSEIVHTLRDQITHLDSNILEHPDLDGHAPLESLRVPGLGKIEFQHDAGGVPSVDQATLLKNALPSVRRAAERLLSDGWQERVDAGMLEDASAYKEAAAKVFIMEKALRTLESQGMGASGEALYIKQAIGRELDLFGHQFDQSNELVKNAIADSGSIIAAEVTPPPVPEIPEPGLGDTAVSPDGERAASADVAASAGATSPPFEPGAGELGHAAPPAETPTHDHGERLKKFVGEDDRVHFRYDKDGHVKDADFPFFRTISHKEMGEAAARWNLSPGQIYNAYEHNGHANDWNVMGHDLMRYMALAEQKEAVLHDMAEQGLQDTPEYAVLAREVISDRGAAAGMLDKVMPGFRIPTSVGEVRPRDFDPKTFLPPTS